MILYKSFFFFANKTVIIIPQVKNSYNHMRPADAIFSQIGSINFNMSMQCKYWLTLNKKRAILDFITLFCVYSKRQPKVSFLHQVQPFLIPCVTRVFYPIFAENLWTYTWSVILTNILVGKSIFAKFTIEIHWNKRQHWNWKSSQIICSNGKLKISARNYLISTSLKWDPK